MTLQHINSEGTENDNFIMLVNRAKKKSKNEMDLELKEEGVLMEIIPRFPFQNDKGITSIKIYSALVQNILNRWRCIPCCEIIEKGRKAIFSLNEGPSTDSAKNSSHWIYFNENNLTTYVQ